MNEESVIIKYKDKYRDNPFLVLESIHGEVVEFIGADFRARELECIIHEGSISEVESLPEVESVISSLGTGF